MFAVIFTSFIAILCFYLLKYIRRVIELEKISKKFPTAPRVPIFGGLPYAPKDPFTLFKALMDIPNKMGPNVVLWGAFNLMDIMITNPSDVENILTSNTTKKSYLYDFIEPWLGQGLLISHGEKWHSRRKILTPSFHFSILKQFTLVFNENNQKLIKKFDENVAQGQKEVDVYELLSACTLDNICETAMGVSVNALDGENKDYVNGIKEMGKLVRERVFSLTGRIPFIYPFTHNARRQKQLLKILHTFTNSVIEERKKQLEIQGPDNQDLEDESKQKFTFLDMLLQSTIEGKSLSSSDIREEVDTFMFEGHDTTTSCLAFTVYHLAGNPSVQEKIFQELETIIKTNGLKTLECNYQILQEMKYLEMVIKESLRLHPPVSAIGRKTLETIQIQGVDIPPGVNLTIPIYTIHRNPEIFADPEKFDPDRFLVFEQQNRNPFIYIPFSAGQRNCIGQKFAMLELKAVLSALIWNYKIISTPKTKDISYSLDLVIRPLKGMHVKLEKR